MTADRLARLHGHGQVVGDDTVVAHEGLVPHPLGLQLLIRELDRGQSAPEPVRVHDLAVPKGHPLPVCDLLPDKVVRPPRFRRLPRGWA